MKKDDLNRAFASLMPTARQKERMLKKLLYGEEAKPRPARQKLGIAAAAFCAALACAAMVTLFPFGGGTKVAYAFSVATPDGSQVVLSGPESDSSKAQFVDNGPELRFFISGQDIAQVEVSSAGEFVQAMDFTQTLDEKFWNMELYYQETVIDGKEYQYVPAKALFYPNITVNYPEGFTGHDRVWYTWYGWKLRDWAEEDASSRIQGYNGLTEEETKALLENASQEERLAIASGGGGTSAAGHFLLQGCPKELLADTVTITITDRQGKVTVQAISIAISSNSLGQTVVSAELQ